jgi:predicted ATPase
LVGPNGSGKSNFIDSLFFVSDALNATLDYAIRQRSGINAVRKRSGGHPTNFAISLRLKLPSGGNAVYSFQVGAERDGGHRVLKEHMSVSSRELAPSEFTYENGKLINCTRDIILPSDVLHDRLAIQIASSQVPIREVFDVLSGAHFYNIYPEDFRLPQQHDNGDYLLRSGKNIASVVRNLENNYPTQFERVCEYLRQIIEPLQGISYRSLGPAETIEFLQRVAGQKHSWRFFASQMSDGTLRSLAILVALFQVNPTKESGLVLGIEEPEATIHPAACAVLTDALIEASRTKQVIVTTHSPELLEHPGLDVEDLRIVQSFDGDTKITPADPASKKAVRERLISTGELLRKNQLQPDKHYQGKFSFLEKL